MPCHPKNNYYNVSVLECSYVSLASMYFYVNSILLDVTLNKCTVCYIFVEESMSMVGFCLNPLIFCTFQKFIIFIAKKYNLND